MFCGYDRQMPTDSEPLLKLRQADIAARGFDDETIVLDLRESMYLATNAAGTALWRALEDGATRSQLVAVILGQFDVSEDQAALDVDAFLDDLRRRGLLSQD